MKILILVLCGLTVVSYIAQAGGWNPKPVHPATYAFCAVFFALVGVGVWLWL